MFAVSINHTLPITVFWDRTHKKRWFYENPHYKVKTVSWLLQLCDGSPYTGLYIGAVNSVVYQYKDRSYIYGGFHNKVGAVVRPFGLHNGHSHAQDFYRHDPVIPVERYLDLLKNIQENTKGIKPY